MSAFPYLKGMAAIVSTPTLLTFLPQFSCVIATVTLNYTVLHMPAIASYL
jgi:hypothetical protein